MEEWNNNVEEDITEAENIEINSESSDDESIIFEPEVQIKSKDAVDALDKVLIWADQEMLHQCDINTIRNLKEKALLKVAQLKSYQKKMTDFFH